MEIDEEYIDRVKGFIEEKNAEQVKAVSYTHLTLPTTERV